MDNRGSRAFRSGYQVVEPELDQVPQDVAEIESEQDRQNATYASLNGHPGWELIKKNFNKTIEMYRSGHTIKGAIAQGKSNTEIGELTRTSNAVADELEQIVLTVEAAAEALEEKRKDGRQRKGNN